MYYLTLTGYTMSRLNLSQIYDFVSAAHINDDHVTATGGCLHASEVNCGKKSFTIYYKKNSTSLREKNNGCKYQRFVPTTRLHRHVVRRRLHGRKPKKNVAGKALIMYIPWLLVPPFFTK